VFPVEHRKPNDRCTCEENVVALVKNIVINCSAAKFAVKTEHPDRDYIEYIFVEHVRNQVSVAAISFSTVTKEKIFQHFELADGIIGCSCRLLSLKTTDSNTNMRSSNHTYVICAVPDCKGRFVWQPKFDHRYNVGFLLGTNPTNKHYFTLWIDTKIYKVFG